MRPSRVVRYLLLGVAAVVMFATATAGLTVATRDTDASGWERHGLDLEPTEETEEAPGVVCEAGPDACDLGRRAAAALPYPWTQLGYTVVIAEPIDEWHAGRTLSQERHIELFADNHSSVRALSATLAHEVGHAVHQRCNDQLLTAWTERRGLPPNTPHHVEAPHNYDSVSEDYAEAFAQWLGYGPSRSTIGESVDHEWLADNADLFQPTICDTLE